MAQIDVSRNYESSEITLENIISDNPPLGGWVHHALHQFQRFANQQCLLLLGFCPQYGETVPAGGVANAAVTPATCFTDVLAGSIARIFGHAISLCARKDCRKVKRLGREQLP